MTVIGPYRLLRTLGACEAGKVWSAFDAEGTSVTVAVLDGPRGATDSWLRSYGPRADQLAASQDLAIVDRDLHAAPAWIACAWDGEHGAARLFTATGQAYMPASGRQPGSSAARVERRPVRRARERAAADARPAGAHARASVPRGQAGAGAHRGSARSTAAPVSPAAPLSPAAPPMAPAVPAPGPNTMELPTVEPAPTATPERSWFEPPGRTATRRGGLARGRRTEPSLPEPRQPEVVRPEVVRPEVIRPDIARPDIVRAEPSLPERRVPAPREAVPDLETAEFPVVTRPAPAREPAGRFRSRRPGRIPRRPGRRSTNPWWLRSTCRSTLPAPARRHARADAGAVGPGGSSSSCWCCSCCSGRPPGCTSPRSVRSTSRPGPRRTRNRLVGCA